MEMERKTSLLVNNLILLINHLEIIKSDIIYSSS